jgi:hypothetical protein
MSTDRDQRLRAIATNLQRLESSLDRMPSDLPDEIADALTCVHTAVVVARTTLASA